MFVAASTGCFPEATLEEAIARLTDLEFTSVEIELADAGPGLSPARVAEEPERAVKLCRDTHRLDVCAFAVRINAEGEEYYRRFTACCKLAKATKVVSLSVESAVRGTPFNEEVERLQRLVQIATLEGVRVSLKNEVGTLGEDPDTIVVLCDNALGLGLAYDPSHVLPGGYSTAKVEKLMKYVHHVRLRDSTKTQLQVRVGQGVVDYGKLIGQLRKVGYHHALCVHITPTDGVDHAGELRKLRLLLESLLL